MRSNNDGGSVLSIRIRESSGRGKRCCSRAKACHTIQMTRILGVSENTLRQDLREYRDGGIERLKEIRFCPPRSEWDAHRESLSSLFRGAPARHGQRSGGQDRRTHRYPAWSDSSSAVLGLARFASAKGRHDPRQGGRHRASAFQKKNGSHV